VLLRQQLLQFMQQLWLWLREKLLLRKELLLRT